MTSITDRLPAALSARLATASSSIYSRQGREVDVAIGGIPFLKATSTEFAESIETAQIRKEQFDAELDPGEQSLTGWWRRSQASFHEGAGLLYQEDSSSNQASNGFFESEGVDVFTPGKVTLLHKMLKATQGSAPLGRLRPYTVNSVRTNLATNPSFGVNTTDWTPTANGGPGGDLPTITRVSGAPTPYIGGWMGKLAWGTDDATGTPPGLKLPVGTISPSAQYTASVQVYVPTDEPGTSANVNVRIVGNGVNGTASVSKNQWVTLSVTGNADGSGVIDCQIQPTTPISGGGLYFYVDACLIELGNTLGAYFDGTTTGGAWTGTAHNSTSTETTAVPSAVSGVGGGAFWTSPTLSGTYASLHAPGGKTIVDGLVAGTNFYDVASDGTLYQGAISAPGSATTWPLGAPASRLAWGKHRLWVIGGRSIWQPDVTSAGGTAQTAIFTNPNLGWAYTCLAEGPQAMYFGGSDGNTSNIQAVTLDQTGGTPSLSGAATSVSLPEGELVQEIAIVAGQYLGIGTNRGFRVGTITNGGFITYGPNLIDDNSITNCTALAVQGRFFIVAFSGQGGDASCYRIDTGNPISEGVYPYAKHVSCDYSGYLTSLTASQGRVVATTSDGQVWYESSTDYVDTGWVRTGRIRYRTTEPKIFKYLGLEIEPLVGSIVCDLIKDDGTSVPVGTVSIQGERFDQNFLIQAPAGIYCSLKFTLVSNTSGSPVMNSYLLRALPAVKPQRLITLPLLCYDREQGKSGQRYGGLDYAKDRLTALQILEDGADSIIYQDFSSTTGGGSTVTIDSLKFVQQSPISGAEGPGGILLAILRTVEL